MANVLWLQGGACSGNTMSFLNAEEPTIPELVVDFGVNILWHPSIGMEIGHQVFEMMESIKKGDQHSLSIACASVLAKTWRDEFMQKCAIKYPDYGFDRHKGYGTALHRQAVELYSPCDIHRMSFRPIRELQENR